MANLDETINAIAKESNENFFRRLFADDVTADIGNIILSAIKNNSSEDLMNLSDLRAAIPSLWERLGVDRIDKAVNDVIAVLLDNHLIEKWEYQEDDGTMVDYYDLPEEDDNDR
jgi:hypothetical protein